MNSIDLEKKLNEANMYVILKQYDKAEMIYLKMNEEYQDYRIYIGLLNLLSLKKVNTLDTAYQTYYEKGLSVCKSDEEKEFINSLYKELKDTNNKDAFCDTEAAIKDTSNNSDSSLETGENIAISNNTGLNDENYSKGLVFEKIYNKEEYAVAGIGKCKDKDIVIPESYQDMPVTTIKYNAFYQCRKITNVVIPSSVHTIDFFAFSDCSSLKEVVIPKSVTAINKRAFRSCTSLTKITIPESISVISDGLFDSCFCLEEVILPNSVTEIGSYAFQNCYSLKSITLPNGLEQISANAFSNCKNIKEITVPDSVTVMGFGIFYNCVNLEKITIPFVGNDFNSIYEGYFGKLFGKTANYDNYNFVPKTLKEVIVTGGNVISDYAFYDCSSIKKIVLPNTIQLIGKNVFAKCNSLESLTIPFVGSRCDLAYDNHFGYLFGTANASDNSLVVPKSLRTVEILGGKSIRKEAFVGCKNLNTVIIPNTIEHIGKDAFLNCTKLKIKCRLDEEKAKNWDDEWNRKNILMKHKTIWNYNE